jgi:GTP-binding protein
MIKVVDASFVTTATEPGQYPREPLPEVAFVGRSNVGKSSMINALAHRKKLVRVSNTPGRTRTLNFFDVTLDRRGGRKTLRLCDLPGYGFAKVSKAEREKWQVMITQYLEQRHTLQVVVLIVDAEVGPTPDDLQMLDLLQEMPPRILVVATKLDRLGKAARKPRLEAIGRRLEIPAGGLLGFSAVERTGADEVWGALLAVVEGR